MNVQGMFQNSATNLLEQVVNFGQMRHNVLAGNVANISTPGYEFRELPPDAFQKLLKEAATSQVKSPLKSAAPAGGLSDLTGGTGASDPFANIGDKISKSLIVNSENRSLEYQVAEITKNQMQHNLALSILQKQYQLMETAISERIA